MSKYHKNCAKTDTDPPSTPGPCRKSGKKETNKVISGNSEARCPEPDDDYLQLLDVITSKDPCSCEITARAVRSDVHANIGLPERDATLQTKSSDEKASKAECSKSQK